MIFFGGLTGTDVRYDIFLHVYDTIRRVAVIDIKIKK